MKLEESINNLKKLVELRKNIRGEIKFDTCICGTKDLETVLQALEKLQKRCKEMIKEKQELRSALLNSIPIEKIENMIKKLNDDGYWDFLEERDLDKTINILQELKE